MLTNTIKSFRQWLHKQIVLDKLNNPLGYAIVVAFALLIALAIANGGMTVGVLLLAAIIGIPMMIGIFVDQNLGIGITVIIAFLIQFLNKYGDYPAGIAMDALVYFMFGAVFIKQIWERDWSFAKHPISNIILVWVIYCFIQALNPIAGSFLAWVFTVRSMAGMLLLYFIACYAFSSLDRIKGMFKFIILLTFLAALYGFKQEFIGFSQTELNWLYADPERFQLIVQWSRFRVFSLFSDPTTFGILMAYMAVFCIILATGPFKLWQRIALSIGALCMVISMGYGGSRTPVVLIPIGMIFFTVITLKKEILIGAGIFFVLGGALMMKGSSNPVLFRIQSAFKPGEDASVQVRLDNQRLIQPYIQRHPFGAGMGATGVWGKRFTPNSWLASFAHDSGFVRIAVEMGWVGLIIYMTFLFKVLQTGIYYYFRVHDPEIKVMYLGMTTICFILTVSSYPQEILVLLPTSIIFYLCVAGIVRLKDFDTLPEDRETLNKESVNIDDDKEIEEDIIYELD